MYEAKATLAQEHYGEWTERDDDGNFVVAWSMYEDMVMKLITK